MCFLMTNASFHRSRCRTVRNPFWVYGPVRYYFYSWNHRQHNTIPHHYLHYYDCRSGNWFWMVIIHPWHKRTDHKSRCFKCLMDRWRLMDTPCYWFKIMNAKSVWKIIAIPTHYIKGWEA
jgi:hypothetical protein